MLSWDKKLNSVTLAERRYSLAPIAQMRLLGALQVRNDIYSYQHSLLPNLVNRETANRRFRNLLV